MAQESEHVAAGIDQRVADAAAEEQSKRDGTSSDSKPRKRRSRSHSRTQTQRLHKPSKSERLSRIEDRLDQIQQQVAATHQMIHELTDSMKMQARCATSGSASRKNSQALTRKALAAMLAPTGGLASKPASPSPMASAVWAVMDASAITRRRSGVDTLPPQFSGILPKPTIADEAASDTSHRSPVMAESTQLEPRQLNTANTLSQRTDRVPSVPSLALIVANATTFVQEASKAVSTKKLQITDAGLQLKRRPSSGPLMSRRVAISSLHSDEKTLESYSTRVRKWSRRLFKSRVEPTVSPDESPVSVIDALQSRGGDNAIHPLTIRHDSTLRTVWDMVVMLLILVDIVLTPLSLSFGFFPKGIGIYNVIGDAIFATDFVVNMFSSYTTSRGVLVSGPRNTIRQYLFSVWSLPDFVSWFPFESLVSEQGKFLSAAKVIRLVKISQLARRFQSAKKVGMFRFFNLLSTVFLVSHCLACYWNWVADEWRVNEPGYLAKSLPSQYSHCWSLVIGSLNASPPAMFTPAEEISVAVFMLIGNILQASVFGSVAVLISSFNEDEAAYNKKLIDTYERCKLLDIPDQLADRIRTYYEHLYRETHSVDPDADAFINELSPALICEVKFQLYRDMVKQIPFFSATTINPVVIEMLILKLRTVIYMQDDVLIRKGEFGDWMGFIGTKGSVGVLDPNSDMRKIIRILRKGDYFGEMGLLHRTKRTTTAVALSWVQIHVLGRDDLDEVKAQYAEEAESLEDEIKKYITSRILSST